MQIAPNLLLKFFVLIFSFSFSAAFSEPPQYITIPGFNRDNVSIHFPDKLKAGKKYPLVVSLHGYGSTGAIQNGYIGLTSSAKKEEFILATPQGTKNSQSKRFWNATDVCCDFENTGVDDVSYLVALTKYVSAKYPVDKNNVNLFGHSNGGFMSYRLACEHADIFKTVVSLAGYPPFASSDCQPSSPVKVIHIHGTADATVGYDGLAGKVLSAPETAQRFARFNKCTSTRKASDLNIVADNELPGAETSTQIWSGCKNNATVELWTINGGSHIPTFDYVSRTFVNTVFQHLKR